MPKVCIVETKVLPYQYTDRENPRRDRKGEAMSIKNKTVSQLVASGGRTSPGGDAPPVSSGRRTQANRSNARRSTGPRTEPGKSFSSRNAVKHGLAAGAGRYLMRALGEDPEQFDALSQRLVAEWRPQTETARQLVDQLAELFWKQARVARAEQALMARQVEELEASRGKLGAEVGRAHCRGLFRAPGQGPVVAAGLARQVRRPAGGSDPAPRQGGGALFLRPLSGPG